MSEPIRKFVLGAVIQDGTLNDREIRVIASDPTPDRVGDIVVPNGCRLDGFRGNPIVLANHDPEKPIGTADAAVKNNRVEALITFAPPGLSKIADEFCGFAKARILNAVSIGFEPVEWDPLPGGGKKFTEWNLLELSIVSVPANPSALVIQRSRAAARAVDDWSPPDLTARERKEFEIRQAIRAKGPLKMLDGDALAAWLRIEFPRLTAKDAFRKHFELRQSMTNHELFMENVRASEFAARHARIEAMSPTEQAEERRREVAASEQITRPVWRTSDAQWCADWRAWDAIWPLKR